LPYTIPKLTADSQPREGIVVAIAYIYCIFTVFYDPVLQFWDVAELEFVSTVYSVSDVAEIRVMILRGFGYYACDYPALCIAFCIGG
jgi:hypothetical protein